MANSATELKKSLKEYGWILSRAGSKHYIYSKGTVNITIPFGKVHSRTFKQILLQIKGRTCYRQKPNDSYSS